ncbi:MAG: nitrile hydratase subunit alpha [Pseudonocardiaceae bacterium]|nr:nitrile hydratase subunit alpha [Pseudonocardiaceae bacterium]
MTHDDHPTSAMTRRVAALERTLVERGTITNEAVDDVLDLFTRKLGAHHGARYIARAWSDEEFRERLLEDATAVVREYGYDLRGATHRELPFLRLEVVENTAQVHNLVVCTLCSCYPIAMLGPPPRWYKSVQYRARAVREPRAVLAEFGVQLDPGVEIRVWDSNADCRYLVLPRRPQGTDGLTESELASLVTRNSLIGTAQPLEEVPA